jgi:cofilin
MYAASKDALKKKLTGIAHEIQATDMGELDQDDVLNKISANRTK